MTRRRIFLSIAVLTAVVGVGSLLYGLAKVAIAEEAKPLAVEVDLPNTVAISPPDESSRTLGYRACGVGVVCLFASAALVVFDFRSLSKVHEGQSGELRNSPFPERGRG